MTVIATKEKSVLSSVVMDDVNALVHDYNYAHGQTATESSDTTYKVGQVVYWDTNTWRILKSTDFTSNVLNASTSGQATAGKALGVVAGFNALGDGKSGIVGSGGADVVVLYQGPVNVKEAGLIFDAGVTGASLANAKLVLAGQGVVLKAVASEATVSFYA